MSQEVHNYTELKQRIHEDLRAQHPEWVKPTGECPECDEHEVRLIQLLEVLARKESTTGPGQREPAEAETNHSLQ